MKYSDNNLDLLFGLTAWQSKFLEKHTLLGCMAAFVDSRGKSFENFLKQQGILTTEQAQAVQESVERKLESRTSSADPLSQKTIDGATAEIFDQMFDLAFSAQTIGEFLAALKSGFDSVGTDLRDPNETIQPSHQMAGDTGDAYQTRAHSPQVSADAARFQVLRPHAKGGLGQVSVAMDREIHREVALKELQLRFGSNEAIKERFLLEAEITGALEHPGIVPVYGCGKYPDGRPYYAMRFVRGDTLLDSLERLHKRVGGSVRTDSVEFRTLIQRIINVCDTIQYAHSRGIIHRDIKPANVIAGDFGETIVVDWGLAKKIGTQDTFVKEPPVKLSADSSVVAPTEMGSVVGTPGYMSPEQAAGRSDLIGKQSDVYSLGATLYHLLTGRSAHCDAPSESFAEIVSGEFDRPSTINPTIPSSLDAICCKAMNKDLSQRYRSASELSDDLQHWMAGQSVSARRETAWEKFSRWCKNHEVLVGSVVAATAVALIAMTFSRLLLQSAYEREQAGFQQTRMTVDQYFTLVSEEDLLDQPGLQPLRRKLLEQARNHYESFVKDRPSSPELSAELGRAHYRLGRIKEIVGSPDSSIGDYQVAISILEKTKSYSLADQQQYATSLNALGRASQKTKQFELAASSYQRSQHERKSLVALQPNNVEYKRQLANTLMNEGTLFRDQKEYAKAIAAYKESQEVRQTAMALIETGGQNQSAAHEFELSRDLGKGYFNLAKLFLQQRNTRLAKENFQLANAKFESANAQKPDDQEVQNQLAVSLRLLGDMEFAQDPIAAIQKYSEALKVMEPLTRFNPQVPDYHISTAHILHNLAIAHQKTGDKEASLAHGQRAIKIYRNQREKTALNPAGVADYGRAALQHAKLALATQPHEQGTGFQTAVSLLNDVAGLSGSSEDASLASLNQIIVESRLELGRAAIASDQWGLAGMQMNQCLKLVDEMEDRLQPDAKAKSYGGRKINIETIQLLRSTVLAEIAACLDLTQNNPGQKNQPSDKSAFAKQFAPDVINTIEEQLANSVDHETIRFDRLRRVVALANLTRSAEEHQNAITACKIASNLAEGLTADFEDDIELKEIQTKLCLIWANSLIAEVAASGRSTKFDDLVLLAKEKLSKAIGLNPKHPAVAPTRESLNLISPMDN